MKNATLVLAALLGCLGARADAQELIATPDRESGIYGLGKTVGWTIAVASGEHASPGAYSFVVKQNGGPVIERGTLDLVEGPARIETSLKSPGMVRVEIRPPAGATQAFVYCLCRVERREFLADGA